MMNKSLLSTVLFFGFLCLVSWSALGQQREVVNCTQKLNQAEDLFDAGNLAEIPKILNSGRGKCFDKGGFSKEEKIRAYRLLALVHLFNDNGPDAEKAVIDLLYADPEHPLGPDDPMELKYLFDKYRSDPIFRIGVKAGANLTQVRSIGAYGSFSNSNEGNKTFKPEIGFQGELTFEYQLIDNLEVLAGVGWSLSQYSLSNFNITSDAENYPSSTAFVLSLKETQQYLKVPLMARYEYPLNNIAPYAVLGVSMDFLLNSAMSGSRAGTTTKQLPSVDLLKFEMRNKINWSYFGGLGVKIRSNRTNFFLLEARYTMGGANVVRTRYRYANNELLADMAHVDDDKILNNISFSIGYIKSIYKPKKYDDKKLRKLSKKRNKNSDLNE